MKKIGLISDRKSKKLFLLPAQVKELRAKNVEVFVNAGYGEPLGIADTEYANAGAVLSKNASEVIAKTDIILKTNAFKKNEIVAANKKIMVTMANYVVNADMILNMLKNNVTSLAWSCLENKDGYIFFPEFEAIKGRHCVNQIIYAWANKGLGLSNAKTDSKRPRVLILNATWAANEAIRACLANNIDVTLMDNDESYLNDLKSDTDIKKLESIFGTKLYTEDAKYETMMRCFKTHDAFINTCIDPMSKTKVRVTNEMAKEMPAGSFMIDAACENGYGFGFQKDFAPEKTEFKSLGNITYSCVANITDLYPNSTSRIISNKSVDYLAALAEKGVDANSAIANVIVTEEGKVVNSSVKTQLRLL